MRLEAQRQLATVHKLENNYRRSKELAANKLVSAEASDQIRYDLESARASYELAKLELSYTNIIAPITGVIAQRMVKPGNLIQPQHAGVPHRRQLAPRSRAQRARARNGHASRPACRCAWSWMRVPGKVFVGEVDRVSPVVDAGSGTFRVVCRFESERQLRPGMFGRIEVVYDQRENALTVPRVALLEDEGEPAVYVVRDAKARRVPVQAGLHQWRDRRSPQRPEGRRTGRHRRQGRASAMAARCR